MFCDFTVIRASFHWLWHICLNKENKLRFIPEGINRGESMNLIWQSHPTPLLHEKQNCDQLTFLSLPSLNMLPSILQPGTRLPDC